MKDLRNILLTALVPALNTATGKNVYTRMPKAANIDYPYIYVGDIYQEENGHKTKYQYSLDVQIQVVFLDIDDLGALLTVMDNVMSIINNGSSLLALSGGYKVTECNLISSSNTDIETEVGVQNIGVIRMLYNIE